MVTMPEGIALSWAASSRRPAPIRASQAVPGAGPGRLRWCHVRPHNVRFGILLVASTQDQPPISGVIHRIANVTWNKFTSGVSQMTICCKPRFILQFAR